MVSENYISSSADELIPPLISRVVMFVNSSLKSGGSLQTWKPIKPGYKRWRNFPRGYQSDQDQYSRLFDLDQIISRY